MRGTQSKISRMASVLEARFFFEANKNLRKNLEELQKKEETMKALSDASGISNETVLHELVNLDIRPETIVALSLIPIIEVAWADGDVDESEQKAILNWAHKNNLSEDESILQQWLVTKPDSKLWEAWEVYLKGLYEIMDHSTFAMLKKEIVDHTRAAAEASGGFLGITSPISKFEKVMLSKIEKAFSELK